MNTARSPIQGREKSPAIYLLYPGDRSMRARCDPAESRFAALFEAFEQAGIRATPAVYSDDFADEVEEQLRGADAVLVWCNPIEGGRRRDRLDALLRRLADGGTLVSAHPDTILKIGTKDVLYETRDLPFGSDVVRIDSIAQLKAELPQRLKKGPRVLKQHRGQSGAGIWRVEAIDVASPDSLLRIRHAQRGSQEQVLSLEGFAHVVAPYFDVRNGGHMIDQVWQPGLVNGMVRAYLVQDRVVGFGHQAINALYPAESGRPAPEPGPRLYYDSDLTQFQGLRNALETQWVDMLCARMGLARERLPILWDCDFMFEQPKPGDSERFALCEINVSSVAPFPPSAVSTIVSTVQARLCAASPDANLARNANQ